MGAIQLAPDLFVGGYDALLALATAPLWRIIVNCGLTFHFLLFLELRHTILILLEVLMFSLDPRFSDADANIDLHGLYLTFINTYGKRLQNYLGHYYHNNPHAQLMVHLLPWPVEQMSPILNGPLTQAFFQFNRLVKLLRLVDHRGVEVLIVGDNLQLAYGLAVLYFMDNYSFNLANLMRVISQQVGYPVTFDGTHYDDLIITDSLQKFYAENSLIKQQLVVGTSRCKRGVDDEEECAAKRRMNVYH